MSSRRAFTMLLIGEVVACLACFAFGISVYLGIEHRGLFLIPCVIGLMTIVMIAILVMANKAFINKFRLNDLALNVIHNILWLSEAMQDGQVIMVTCEKDSHGIEFIKIVPVAENLS